MIKKLKCVLIGMCACMLLMLTPVLALDAVISDVDVSASVAGISVSGAVDADCAYVTLEVWNNENVLIYMGPEEVAEGVFSCTVLTGGLEPGNYTVKIADLEGGPYFSRTVVVSAPSLDDDDDSPSGGSSAPTYTSSVQNSENGSVSVSPKNAKKGETVTLTPKADAGYVLESLTVTDRNGNKIQLTEKDGKYTFTMPASRVDIKAVFAEETFENPFADVSEKDYYYNAVMWAVKNGVTGGTSATTFSPNAQCARAQAVTFLWRAAGSPVPKNTTMPFDDVADNAYYRDAVLWAVENGITSGTSATTFGPDVACSRAQIMTFLWRTEGSPVVSDSSSFTDVPVVSYYADAVNWAADNNITAGTSATTFGSDDICNRGQIVTFLFKCFGE